jgi:hypothetical protein
MVSGGWIAFIVNENVVDKVNRVIKDPRPHRVTDVTVSAARRIPNLNDNDLSTPRVVIAPFRTSEDHSTVMKAKSNLRDTPFSDVFIHQDQSREERLSRKNVQVMVNAVNRGGSISLRGNRVVQGSNNNGNSNRSSQIK